MFFQPAREISKEPSFIDQFLDIMIFSNPIGSDVSQLSRGFGTRICSNQKDMGHIEQTLCSHSSVNSPQYGRALLQGHRDLSRVESLLADDGKLKINLRGRHLLSMPSSVCLV